MFAGFYTVIVGLIGIYLIRAMLIKRDNGIPFKGGLIMFVSTLLITFGNSFIEGGSERIAQMFQLNMIISSFCGIIIGGMFFWKRRDIFAFLDKNKLLFNWKVTPSGAIENLEEWQKEQGQEKAKEKGAMPHVSHSKSVSIPKEDVLERIRKDREHIKSQGSDNSPQLRFETGKEMSEEERHRQFELDAAKKRQRQIEQEEDEERRRVREHEERQRQQNIAMQQNTQYASAPSNEYRDCGSGSSGGSSGGSSSNDSGSSSSSSSSSSDSSSSSSCD